MDSRFKKCLYESKLVKVEVQPDLVKKEISEAESDLKSAQTSLAEGNPKWATVQSYYSMFHAAKALVLSAGYREKSHYCLSIALKALFVDQNILPPAQLNRFRDCMEMRHEADYGSIYSGESSGEAVGWASEFFEEAKKILKINKLESLEKFTSDSTLTEQDALRLGAAVNKSLAKRLSKKEQMLGKKS